MCGMAAALASTATGADRCRRRRRSGGRCHCWIGSGRRWCIGSRRHRRIGSRRHLLFDRHGAEINQRLQDDSRPELARHEFGVEYPVGDVLALLVVRRAAPQIGRGDAAALVLVVDAVVAVPVEQNVRQRPVRDAIEPLELYGVVRALLPGERRRAGRGRPGGTWVVRPDSGSPLCRCWSNRMLHSMQWTTATNHQGTGMPATAAA